MQQPSHLLASQSTLQKLLFPTLLTLFTAKISTKLSTICSSPTFRSAHGQVGGLCTLQTEPTRRMIPVFVLITPNPARVKANFHAVQTPTHSRGFRIS